MDSVEPGVAPVVEVNAELCAAYDLVVAGIPESSHMPLDELIKPEEENDSLALESFDIAATLAGTSLTDGAANGTAADDSADMEEDEDEDEVETQIKAKEMLRGMEMVAQYI
ncbi:hypothetical protein GGI15_004764 [Coemansia interrupta]|uniref:Uncharacterized protein n=1 Tax=Coemansia interrupta TaxID=1126814 RepID=A0A9W8H4U1_9FUNG|nr:hypothetical protein GGI15_004764 [Coemansia interrupta]